ncbi:MAG: histidine--tRNA ligase, partial [bacterium]|nr:histidine--tRNA ligase [bacterium]
KGRSLTLRPEGTASVARAFIENGFGQRPQPVRLSYFGPMFRYEKMQRGRYRQFAQIGIELLGSNSSQGDVEVILALHQFLASLGFSDLVIKLNNLGDPEDRERFIDGLKEELSPRKEELCRDCHRRWDENPLRILDCKIPTCKEIVSQTTPIADVAGDETKQHVDQVEISLEGLGIPVQRAPRLVRGLDYYLRTVFEVVSPELGEDTVICGGGRYDRLISDLGGRPVPGIGFAIGEDRLIDVLPESFRERVLGVRSVVMLPVGTQASQHCFELARKLVDQGVRAQNEVTGRSIKAGLKWAGKIGAELVIIVGEQEIKDGQAVIRDLARGEQEKVAMADVVDDITRRLGTS